MRPAARAAAAAAWRLTAGGLTLGCLTRPLGAQPAAPPAALAGARQLVLVTSDGWDVTTGTLRRYARPAAGGPWRPVGGAVPVTLGRTGMAWGAGQGTAPNGAPVKREGDGRSPAGAFPLLHAFAETRGNDDFWEGALPELPLHDGTVCVDDPRSTFYNAIVEGDSAGRGPWASAERMRQVAGYRRGVVVGYNGAWTRGTNRHGPLRFTTPGGRRPVPGRGSCIFLHIWDGPDRPTAGCTAMAEPAMNALAGWLDARERPVLVQFPAGVLARVRARWALPPA